MTAAVDLAAPARRTLARRKLSHFLSLLVPEYEQAPHALLLCEHLEALERREIRKLIVTMPPQHGKSLHVSQGLPAWWLGKRPADSVILASYSGELAQRNSRRARGFLGDPLYPFQARVSSESSAVGRWHTTSGGGVIAVGTGGGLTGWRGDLLVADDLFAGRTDADSQAVRDSTWAWWAETALTRLRPESAILATMTRWHEDDLVGRLIDSEGADEWTVLNLPALATDDDALGRKPDEALWPTIYGPAWLDAQRREIGERAWSALYMGSPTPDKGAIFQREWLGGRYSELPDNGLAIITAVDASFGKSVQSDYSAIVTVASNRKSYYVLHAVRGRWDFNTLCQEIKKEASAYGARTVIVEDAAAGQSAIQELKRTTGLPVVPVKPAGSKLSRAEAISPLFESERVFFPSETTRWRDELIEELAGFPSARYDDQVDAIVYALDRLRSRHGSVVKAPSGPIAPGGSTWSQMGGGAFGGGGSKWR
jgi:predicted phage terminase large subunit-like protein